MRARDSSGNWPNGPDRYGRGHSFARHPLWSKFEVQIWGFQNRPQILIASFLNWYDIMRTSILAHRSVQNKTGQKSCSRCIFAVKNVSKNVKIWGTRKRAKIVIFWYWRVENFGNSCSPKILVSEWVNPVWGYIIFITSIRNSSKKVPFLDLL